MAPGEKVGLGCFSSRVKWPRAGPSPPHSAKFQAVVMQGVVSSLSKYLGEMTVLDMRLQGQEIGLPVAAFLSFMEPKRDSSTQGRLLMPSAAPAVPSVCLVSIFFFPFCLLKPYHNW